MQLTGVKLVTFVHVLLAVACYAPLFDVAKSTTPVQLLLFTFRNLKYSEYGYKWWRFAVAPNT